MTQIVRIPRDSGEQAAEQLQALEGQAALSDDQAAELLAYLEETEFEPLQWCLGELAATLLRDQATASVRARVWDLCPAADDRHLYFYLVALSNENKDRFRLQPYLERALTSEEGTLRAFASELLWSKPPPGSLASPDDEHAKTETKEPQALKELPQNLLFQKEDKENRPN
jgi:hypothetical protein